VEFEPPQKLKPAQVGLILDESADTKDVTATIVDLGVRGFLTIREVPGKHDWLLTRKQGEVPGLLPCERTPFYGLFANRRRGAMARRPAAGGEVMQKTLRVRRYMNTAEKYREQFAEKAEIFTQLVPYASVFGCVSRWAKAFGGIDTSAANNWYVGNAPFQAALLSSSLESMNSSLSSAIASSPPSSGSSSGFGGGGGSGGGGGGGGGGSW